MWIWMWMGHMMRLRWTYCTDRCLLLLLCMRLMWLLLLMLLVMLLLVLMLLLICCYAQVQWVWISNAYRFLSLPNKYVVNHCTATKQNSNTDQDWSDYCCRRMKLCKCIQNNSWWNRKQNFKISLRSTFNYIAKTYRLKKSEWIWKSLQ